MVDGWLCGWVMGCGCLMGEGICGWLREGRMGMVGLFVGVCLGAEWEVMGGAI